MNCLHTTNFHFRSQNRRQNINKYYSSVTKYLKITWKSLNKQTMWPFDSNNIQMLHRNTSHTTTLNICSHNSQHHNRPSDTVQQSTLDKAKHFQHSHANQTNNPCHHRHGHEWTVPVHQLLQQIYCTSIVLTMWHIQIDTHAHLPFIDNPLRVENTHTCGTRTDMYIFVFESQNDLLRNKLIGNFKWDAGTIWNHKGNHNYIHFGEKCSKRENLF